MTQPRLHSLDLYRGLAVLLMIAAHSCDAFLALASKHGFFWYALDITFGFVAPAFLFVSGATLAVSLSTSARTTTNALPSARSRATLLRRAKRLAFILFLAYWLQIPILSLRQLVWNQRPFELARLFDSNILHVVAIGGLLCIALDMLLHDRRARIVAAILACTTVIVTPFVQSVLAPNAWLPVRAFIAQPPHSTFPLFPNIAFLIIGFAFASIVVVSTRRRAGIAAASGAALMLIAGATHGALTSIGVVSDFWHASIPQFLFRLGGVYVGHGASLLVSSYARNRSSTQMSASAHDRSPAEMPTSARDRSSIEMPTTRGLSPWPSMRSRVVELLERIGRLSLSIYVLHLALIYGSPVTMGMRYWFNGLLGGALSPGVTFVVFVAITVAVVCVAECWSRATHRSPAATRIAWWIGWLAFTVLFVSIP